MAMIQTFFVSLLLFFQSAFAPLIYDIPKGAVDYGGGAYAAAGEVTEGLRLFEDGETDYVIVIPDGAPQSFYTGARWLNEFLNEMLGRDKNAPGPLTVIAESAYESGKFISIGKTALGGSELESAVNALETDESFVKMTVGDNIFISGSAANGRGTMYGCASFIEEQLGCRWYTPELRTTPKKQTIFIKDELYDAQNPMLDYRDDYWPYVYLYPEFKAFHKLNSFMGMGMGAEYGNQFNYFGGFCHTLWFLLPQSMFAAEPTLFSYQKDRGEWTPHQRCLTNPRVFEIVRDGVFEWISHHENDPNFKIVSVTQEDNDYPCQCDNCLAMDAMYGGPSGTNIWFTNEIARAVKERFPHRPDILIDTFAYTYTVKPPKNIVPDKNVIVRFCTMGSCFVHPLEDCGHGRGSDGIFADMKPHTSALAQYMREWNELCKVNGAQMYVWDYTTCFEFYPAIYPNFQVLAANLQFFVENSVRGVYEQGYDTGGTEVLPGSASGEFGEMRGYLLAKLLWDPYQNTNQIMDEFMNAYYGRGAAPYVREFLDYFTNKTIGMNHLGVFGRVEVFTYLTPAECRKMDALFDKAEQAAAGNKDQLLAVKRTRLCLKLHEANYMIGDYSWCNPNRLRNNKALFYECVLLGLDRFSAAMVEPYNTYVWLHRPYDWAKMKSWIDFVDVDKLVPMDLEAYRQAHGTP
ncbi:MAG: DUF4838 domain-containing protein [Oscillospiraceae bacterium]|nr:DUF4838 domain-containing protein [Oscillospiraceae bacterium]